MVAATQGIKPNALRAGSDLGVVWWNGFPEMPQTETLAVSAAETRGVVGLAETSNAVAQTTRG